MKSQDDHLTLGDTPQAALTANLQGDSQDGSEYVSSEAEGTNFIEDIKSTQSLVPHTATVTPPPEPLQPTDPANTPRETCHLLNEIGNALQNITQTLISTQHFLARVSLALVVHNAWLHNQEPVFNTHDLLYFQSTISGDWNGLVDQKGDLPAVCVVRLCNVLMDSYPYNICALEIRPPGTPKIF